MLHSFNCFIDDIDEMSFNVDSLGFVVEFFIVEEIPNESSVFITQWERSYLFAFHILVCKP